MSIRRTGWTLAALCGLAMGAIPLTAFAGGPLDWYNALNRQLGLGWSDGYHAKGRGMVDAEPAWQTLPPRAAPAPQTQPLPARQPAVPLDDSVTRPATPASPASWSLFPFFATQPTAPAEPYPTTKQHSIVIPAPQPAPAARQQPTYIPPPTYRAPHPPGMPPPAAPPRAPQPAPPAAPSTFGGFYPEEMPAP